MTNKTFVLSGDKIMEECEKTDFINKNMVEWYCPQCGEVNSDLINQYTHCAYCGRVVFVSDEDDVTFDDHWNVVIK